MQKYVNVLLGCALFEGIEEKDLSGMLSCLRATSRAYSRGEIVLEEGSPAEWLGVVLSGEVQVIREDYYGNRSMMGKLGAGDIFAEAIALSGTETMPVTVAALHASEVMLIDVERIAHPCSMACGFHQRLIYNLMRILARKNLACNQKIEVTSRRSTRDKLMAYLMMQAKQAGSNRFSIPFDRQELADYLEVDRSGLSSEIGKLRREGVLLCEKNRFELL